MNMSSKNPLVSVITPSYNQAPYLEACLRSVLEQEYEPIQYIVVDGGSTDGSVKILERYTGKIDHWVSEPDSGQTEAINKGFNLAEGQILAWLNSDDVLYPHAVAEAVDFLKTNPEVGMVYGDADYLDTEGSMIGSFPAAQTDARRLRRGYVHIPQQASFFRGTLWKMVGPLDPTFSFAMDYDLWVRISQVTHIRYNPRRWAGFRLHGEAKTSEIGEKCWQEMYRVHRRMGGGRFSIFYFKYLIRRAVEPWMPLRLRMRLWAHELKDRWGAEIS